MFPLLHIKDLQIDFATETGTVTAVKDIDITVNRNEIVGIAGESGSGKSVTALSVLQLLSPKTVRYPSGQILFSKDGLTQQDLLQQENDSLRAIRGKEIGMIFQEPMTSLNPVYTCGYQVMEAIRLHQQVNDKMARARTIELFDRVKLPDPHLLFDRYPHQLSGGQKQRVMIAMSMSGHPSLLICDEPTTALDVTVQQKVLELIRDLQKETHIGVIFITHDLGVINSLCDRVVIMYRGRIVEQGPVNSVFTSPGSAYTKGLLLCRPALYRKGDRLPVVADFTGEKTNQAAPSGASTPAGPAASAEPLITINELSVWFPSKKSLLGKPVSFTKAVDEVTFDIYKGETLGLVGESGCGKTTLGRALLQLILATSGTIRYGGLDFAGLNPKQKKEFRRNIQIVFQDPYSSLNPSLTIGSAIAEPLRVHEPRLGAANGKARVAALLKKVGLDASHYHRYPHEFSGGQRQRIVIARALALRPSFIVCDESVSALDVSVQAQVLNLLNDLKKEFGFTIVFISHDLSVVKYVSDRIMVMNSGRIEEIGPADEVYRHPASAYTRRLLEAIPSITPLPG